MDTVAGAAVAADSSGEAATQFPRPDSSRSDDTQVSKGEHDKLLIIVVMLLTQLQGLIGGWAARATRSSGNPHPYLALCSSITTDPVCKQAKGVFDVSGWQAGALEQL